MPKKGKPSRKRLADFNSYNLSTDEVQEGRGPSIRSLLLRRAQALQFLSGTNMPSKFRFRERELERINSFLSECLGGKKKGYRFLMVTGSPGAGKTLCLNSVLSGLECEVLRLNANVVRSVGEVQALLTVRLLGDQRPRTAPQIIRELQERKYKGSLVVYVQEIQLLFKSAPDAVSQDFLTLFLRKSINLILIGVSNTIDTLQKYSGKYSFKVSDIENIVFAPYRAEHIATLLQQKLSQVSTKFQLIVQFPEKLLRFAAQKLQSLRKGDFRICMQFLKETVRLCLAGVKQGEEVDEQHWTIDIGMLNEVFDKMQISKNDLMSKLPYQQGIILIAMHNVIMRTDALCVSLKELQPELKWICGSLQIAHSVQLVDQRLKDLQQYGVILLRKKIVGVVPEVQVMLQVSTDDIRATFTENELLGKFLISGK